ncbi:hypothetical protein HDV63DRAFT_388956, partial [Trichoderma sp. SZMC 28014]
MIERHLTRGLYLWPTPHCHRVKISETYQISVSTSQNTSKSSCFINMDKCWFVLRQTNYPAPEYKHSGMAFGIAEGPVRLGHFISGPKEIDNVINSDDITPFPRDMRIWLTKTVDFRYSIKDVEDVQASAVASAPNTAGMTANVEAGVVFRKLMGDTWSIDQLDTQIVQPTMTYLEQCRTSDQVAAWIEKNKLLGFWKIYMISGLMIARGAKYQRNEVAAMEQKGGGGADLLGEITIEAKAKHADKKEVGITGRHINDFVWAIRLTEVSKSFFKSHFSQSVVKKGTVFAPSSDEVDIDAILTKEGIIRGSLYPFKMSNGDGEEYLVEI